MLSALSLNGLTDLSLRRMEEELNFDFLKKRKETHHMSHVFSKESQYTGKKNAQPGYKALTQCYLVLSTA